MNFNFWFCGDTFAKDISVERHGKTHQPLAPTVLAGRLLSAMNYFTTNTGIMCTKILFNLVLD